MTTPGWPQLAGWLATPTPRTVRGTWQSQLGAGTFAYRAPHDWYVTGVPGGQTQPLRWLVRPGLGPHRAPRTVPGPVRPAVHDGRPCWRVTLGPSDHHDDGLVLLVDDATGLCLWAGDPSGRWWEQVRDLEIDPDLPDEPFAAGVRERERLADERASYARHRAAPVPTPRWFPWRRSRPVGDQHRTVEGVPGYGEVARVRLGQELPEAFARAVVVEHDGWRYGVTGTGIDDATAVQVVHGIVEGRPWDW